MIFQELITKIKKGNKAAELELYKLLYKPMYSVCRRYTKTMQDAEERTMDGFRKVFSSIDDFVYVDDSTVRAWIKTIMVNGCVDQLRVKRSFVLMPEIHEDEAVTIDKVESDLHYKDILKVICELSDGYRTVFNLYVFDKYSHADISILLGISESTSRSQLARAKTLLQQKLISIGAVDGKRKEAYQQRTNTE